MRSGMIGFLGAQPADTGDPYWDKVVALLHFDGDLIDDVWGNWSLLTGEASFTSGRFNQSMAPSGSINILSPAEAAVTDLRGSDFTIEFFIKPSGSGNQTVLASNGVSGTGNIRGSLVRLTSGREILFAHLGQPSNLISSPLQEGAFTHVAICWDSNSRRLYLDGVLDAEDTDQSGWVTGTPFPLRIGRYQTSPADYLQSAIDELRITKGVARYTENFTPPTEPFPNQ